jgi:hypothetical protein
MDITQLEASARVRDDLDAQRQFAEIRLRACIRIGEISRELETHQGLRSNDETKSRRWQQICCPRATFRTPVAGKPNPPFDVCLGSVSLTVEFSTGALLFFLGFGFSYWRIFAALHFPTSSRDTSTTGISLKLCNRSVFSQCDSFDPSMISRIDVNIAVNSIITSLRSRSSPVSFRNLSL